MDIPEYKEENKKENNEDKGIAVLNFMYEVLLEENKKIKIEVAKQSEENTK